MYNASPLRLVGMAYVLDTNVAILLEARGHDVGLNGLEIDVGNLSLITVEDLGNLLKSGSLSLDVENGDEDELEEDPALDNISLLLVLSCGGNSQHRWCRTSRWA
jgi:hypothetical protein